jgi:hypothetical protein
MAWCYLFLENLREKRSNDMRGLKLILAVIAVMSIYELSQAATVTNQATKVTILRQGHPTNNYGTNISVELWGIQGGSAEDRGMVQWDLSNVSESNVVSAVIRLRTRGTVSDYSDSGTVVNIHKLTRSWLEDSATWDKYDGTNDWAIGGGDYPATIYSTQLLPQNTNWSDAWQEWDITELAQEWIDGTSSNYGIVVRTPTTWGNYPFYSNDEGYGSLYPPELIINTTATIPPRSREPQTITNQSIKVAWLRQGHPTNNYGSNVSVDLWGGQGGSAADRGIIEWDLSEIYQPIVESAIIRLRTRGKVSEYSAGGTVVNIHKLTHSWLEDSVTWDSYDGTNNWSVGGGNYPTNIYASQLLPQNTNWSSAWLEWDITKLAQEWVDGASSNYGVIVRTPTSYGNYPFYSDDKDGGTFSPPELIVKTKFPTGAIIVVK